MPCLYRLNNSHDEKVGGATFNHFENVLESFICAISVEVGVVQILEDTKRSSTKL